jgi:hypothetical protein
MNDAGASEINVAICHALSKPPGYFFVLMEEVASKSLLKELSHLQCIFAH